MNLPEPPTGPIRRKPLFDEPPCEWPLSTPWPSQGHPCPFCEQPSQFWIADYSDESISFGSCCDGHLHEWLDTFNDMENDEGLRKWFSAWLAYEAGIKVRGIWNNSMEFIADWGLELRPIEWKEAKDFVVRHHEFGSAPAGWRWGHAVYNGLDLIGVAIVGRPVARSYNADEIVEVSRCCVRRDWEVGRKTWNACSMLYGAASKEAKRRGYKIIQTYITEDELGVTMRASGWSFFRKSRGGSRAGQRTRKRIDVAPTCPKLLFRKNLKKRSPRQMVFKLAI